MSVKITEVVQLDRDASNPVLLLNMYKYLWQMFGAKGFRAKDQTFPAKECDGSNVVFVAGEQQLYRGYIGGLDVDGNRLNPPKRPATEQLRTYVAKRNRVTGQMRLVEVESCQLGNVSHDTPRQEVGTNTSLDLPMLRRLQLQFGSKASNALMNRIHSKHFDLGMMEQKLKQTIADCVVKEEEAPEAATGEPKVESNEFVLATVETEICNKANPKARQLSELYQAESLIGRNVLHKLTQPAKKLLQTDPEQLQMANAYLEHRVKALMQSPDVTAEKIVQHARICLYMDVLGRLMDRTKRHQAPADVSPFAPSLKEVVRNQYMQSRYVGNKDQPTVTKYTRHKALMYYLALVFVLEEQSMVSVSLVHQSLQVPKVELCSFARAIGARYDVKTDAFALGKLEKRSEANELMHAIELAGKNRSGRR